MNTPLSIAVIAKRSEYELLQASSHEEDVRFLSIPSESLECKRKSHDAQKRNIDQVLETLTRQQVFHRFLYRDDLGKNISLLNRTQLVMTLGGDGTFLSVSQYVRDVPMMGVNTDPGRSIGFYCACDANGLEETLERFAYLPVTNLNRLQLTRNGEELPELVLNDILFIKQPPAANTRFEVDIDDKLHYVPFSYGLMLSTASGSTAGISKFGASIMNLPDRRIQYATVGGSTIIPGFAEQVTIHSMTRRGMVYISGESGAAYELGNGDVLDVTVGIPLIAIGDLQRKQQEYCTRKENKMKLD